MGGMGKRWKSAPQRAGEDYREWLRNHILLQPLSFLVPGGGTMVATFYLPPDVSILTAALN